MATFIFCTNRTAYFHPLPPANSKDFRLFRISVEGVTDDIEDDSRHQTTISGTNDHIPSQTNDNFRLSSYLRLEA